MSALQQQAFRLAARELGMATAAWLFVRETAAEEPAGTQAERSTNGRPDGQTAGPSDAVATLRDTMGRDWPVLDAVCAGWLTGRRETAAPVEATEQLLQRVAGASRIVLVGYEAAWVDALLAGLPPDVRVGLVQAGDPQTHWARMLSNHGGRLQALTLADFQSWAGPRSVLLTFVYGVSGQQVFVLPSWLRATGPDVRLQFRNLVGWQVLGLPLAVYPRWLVAADRQTLTDLVATP